MEPIINEAHGDGAGMPAASAQTTKDGAFGCFLVQVEGLCIILTGKFDYLFFGDRACCCRERGSRCDIFPIDHVRVLETQSGIEAEMHDVTVGDDIFFALEAHFPGVFGAAFTLQ